ncbi:hypothetical protein LXL04_010815 [Taraxacum kok-saghyz]
MLLLTSCVNGIQRELKEGRPNAVALYMHHGISGIVEEEVVKEMMMLAENQRREMLKLVLQTNGSIIPRVCKDVIWNAGNVLNYFYAIDDGFTGNFILDIVKEIIYEPISHESMIKNTSMIERFQHKT